MLKKKEITNVSNVCFCNNDVVIIGNNKYIGSGIKIKAEFGMRPAICLVDKILFQYEQFGEIDVFDFHGNSLRKLNLDLNLYSYFFWDEKIVLVSRKTKTYWSVDKNIELENLHFYKHYNFQISSQFYSIENQEGTFFLAQCDFNKATSNWKIKLSGKIFINSGQRPVGDSEYMYIPFQNRLVCINVNSGEELWEISSSHSFDIDDDVVIQNRGDSIVEIDKRAGEKLRILTYCETPELSNFRSNGPIWIFRKYICVIDTLKGIICLIEKEGFNNIEIYDLRTKIPNDRKSIRMNNSTLYVLDNKNKLHILEPNLHI